MRLVARAVAQSEVRKQPFHGQAGQRRRRAQFFQRRKAQPVQAGIHLEVHARWARFRMRADHARVFQRKHRQDHAARNGLVQFGFAHQTHHQHIAGQGVFEFHGLGVRGHGEQLRAARHQHARHAHRAHAVGVRLQNGDELRAAQRARVFIVLGDGIQIDPRPAAGKARIIRQAFHGIPPVPSGCPARNAPARSPSTRAYPPNNRACSGRTP